MSSSTPAVRKRAESFSEPSVSDDATKILYVLRALSPEHIISRLMMHIGPDAASNARGCAQLLAGLKAAGFANEFAKAEVAVTDNERRHCVRCHAYYLEKDNARYACVVPADLSKSIFAPETRTRHTTNYVTVLREKHNSVVKTCDELRCGSFFPPPPIVTWPTVAAAVAPSTAANPNEAVKPVTKTDPSSSTPKVPVLTCASDTELSTATGTAGKRAEAGETTPISPMPKAKGSESPDSGPGFSDGRMVRKLPSRGPGRRVV